MTKAALGVLLIVLAIWFFIDAHPPIVDFPTAG